MKKTKLPDNVALHVKTVLCAMTNNKYRVQLHRCFQVAQTFCLSDDGGRTTYCEGTVQNPHGEGQPQQQHGWAVVDGIYIIDLVRELIGLMHPQFSKWLPDDVYSCGAVYTRQQLLQMDGSALGGPLSFTLEEVKQNG
jgi:hypothetical protein